MKGIADTGFIVAFSHQHDKYHSWATDLAERVREPLLTCEPVLAEASFHLRDCALVLSLIDDGLLRLAFEVSGHLPQLAEFAQRYSDRHPDFADLCLIRMSELYPRHSVITVDEADFRVYRRNKRDVIPLICPPRR
ncbi:MAG TPA: hypothetical protein VFA85_17255 [Terriglobales bacterium]|nr:hypothetical protein [Terriglobales bacterium]